MRRALMLALAAAATLAAAAAAAAAAADPPLWGPLSPGAATARSATQLLEALESGVGDITLAGEPLPPSRCPVLLPASRHATPSTGFTPCMTPRGRSPGFAGNVTLTPEALAQFQLPIVIEPNATVLVHAPGEGRLACTSGDSGTKDHAFVPVRGMLTAARKEGLRVAASAPAPLFQHCQIC